MDGLESIEIENEQYEQRSRPSHDRFWVDAAGREIQREQDCRDRGRSITDLQRGL